MAMTLIHEIEKVMSLMNPFEMNAGFRRLAMVLLLALALPLASVSAASQQTFSTPEAAVDAFDAALKANDDAALVALFGEKHKNLVITGDRAHDTELRAQSAAKLATFRALEDRCNDRRVLLVGAEAWPFPIPLVRQGGAWRFASE